MDRTWDTDFAGRFATTLLEWSAANPRPLPWKGEADPYLIWLSEIILQQTRVEQGLPYFERFRTRFPTVGSLASASDDEVFKLWEGLGYYSRARNLLAAARHIVSRHQGRFPDTYEGIRALKGVGPYTAAAIASFAFGLPHAVVDGNVYRVLARVLGEAVPIDTTEGKRLFADWAQQLLDPQRPGAYNQAIMDFGAIHCKPVAPLCGSCPMRSFCKAHESQQVESLPVKSRRLVRKTRHFHYLVLRFEDKVLLRKRTRKDIWQNLYDFPLVEAAGEEIELDELMEAAAWQEVAGGLSNRLHRRSPAYRQTLSHQNIVARFWEFELSGSWKMPEKTYVAVEPKNFPKFAFPKIVDLYLSDKSLFL